MNEKNQKIPFADRVQKVTHARHREYIKNLPFEYSILIEESIETLFDCAENMQGVIDIDDIIRESYDEDLVEERDKIIEQIGYSPEAKILVNVVGYFAYSLVALDNCLVNLSNGNVETSLVSSILEDFEGFQSRIHIIRQDYIFILNNFSYVVDYYNSYYSHTKKKDSFPHGNVSNIDSLKVALTLMYPDTPDITHKLNYYLEELAFLEKYGITLA